MRFARSPHRGVLRPDWGAVRIALGLFALIAGPIVSPSPADATRFRRPHRNDVGLNAGFDNNFAAGGCTDAVCGGNCYNGHTGSDFNLGVGSDVLAGAGGTVSTVVQGCPDAGYYCSPCGGRCGNHVRINHPDGTATVYCHLRNGSVTVGVGQGVDCGQKIAESASSGCSTGPHLHFGWIRGGSAREPYSGGCSSAGGAWVNQGNFGRSPSAECENQCECSPGQVQEDGCGRCGRRRRGCGGDCRWGGWSGCEGEGVCAAGATEAMPCCDCGQSVRTCGGNCQWGEWGACGGPDPPGAPPCDTGKPGVCADGTIRCLQGCLGCADDVAPSPERCDALDNDCDAVTDEDATELSEPPPPLAAQIEDLSAPMALRPGERATVWATFRNVGSAPWPAGAAGIAAEAPEAPVSPLRDEQAWASFDVPAGLPGAVPPGGTTRVQFPVVMPPVGRAATRFDVVVDGARVLCPEPGFDLDPARLASATGAPDAAVDTPDAGDDVSSVRSAGGCAAVPSAPSAPWVVLAIGAGCRRRRDRSSSRRS